MERDFEREFKELKLNEVPDLWSRIEAGLTEKKAAAVSPSIALPIDKYKAGKRIVWRKWGALAAACLCVAVILPALSLVIGNLGGRKNSYSGFSASNADSGAGGSLNGASADDFSNAMDMTDASEIMFNQETAEVSENADNSKMTDVSENVEKLEAASADDADSNAPSQTLTDEAKQMNSVQSGEAETQSRTECSGQDSLDSAEDSMAADYELSGGLENGQILDGAVVEILSSASSAEGAVYQAVVKQADEDGFLAGAETVSIVCDSDTKYDFAKADKNKQALKKGESYEVSLRYEQDNKNGAASQSGGLSENGRFVVAWVKKY